MTITWLKVTENNKDRDEVEAITFGREPAKTVVPIPFTKELSSCQMMHVTASHFFPCRCFTRLFLHLKTYLLQSLNSCRNLFFTGRHGSDSLLHTWGMQGFCVEEILMWNTVSIQLWCRIAVVKNLGCIKRDLYSILVYAEMSG